jgi:hypothetical protein
MVPSIADAYILGLIDHEVSTVQMRKVVIECVTAAEVRTHSPVRSIVDSVLAGVFAAITNTKDSALKYKFDICSAATGSLLRFVLLCSMV